LLQPANDLFFGAWARHGSPLARKRREVCAVRGNAIGKLSIGFITKRQT